MQPEQAGMDMTQTEKMARFAAQATFDQISPEHVERLKIHVLDTIGCALGALAGDPVLKVGEVVRELGG
ncbi:MAG: 2-methylcitrate dehydratase, partial [Fimbriimonadaceae bacterium]|nr:2-methylcitrate dehydratase [Fimbriimonadaceae bacterium]